MNLQNSYLTLCIRSTHVLKDNQEEGFFKVFHDVHFNKTSPF